MVRSICHPGNLVRHPQVFSPDEPVSVLFAAFAAVDKGGCGGTGSGCGGLGWERTYTSMKNICARETTPGVIMKVIIFALIGVVFHGPHGMGLHT
jgi:hypothetical protein